MPPSIDDAEIREIYSIYRSYSEHENDLINHRTTWGITIQSFVIATFGFCYQKKYEIAEKIIMASDKIERMQPDIFDFNILLLFLVVIGSVTATSTYYSVWAATKAIYQLDKYWNEGFRMKYDHARALPPMMGGGHPESGRMGQWLPLSLPVFFIVFWCIVGVFIVSSAVGVSIKITPYRTFINP
ncbi:MAG: hypothetical protein WDN25_23705 [Acetobacteraceae bacterium]